MFTPTKNVKFCLTRKKVPWIPLASLCQPRLQGGMAVLNLMIYFHVARLSMFTKYHVITETPIWVKIEVDDSPKTPFSNLLLTHSWNRGHIRNLKTSLSLHLWDSLKVVKHLISPYTKLQSIMHNPTFLQHLPPLLAFGQGRKTT